MITDLLGLFAFPPERLVASLVFVAAFLIACEYLRIGLMIVGTRSRLVHFGLGLLTTVIQPVALGAGLWVAIARHPDRALLDIGLVAAMFGVWYAAGESTRLVRPDSQGADPGFMSLSAALVLVVAAIAVGVH